MQTLKHNREPFESELNDEVAREYIRQQEEKHGSAPDHDKDIEEMATRITEMEENATRLESNMDKVHRRLEAMMKLLLAATPNAVDMAVLETEEVAADMANNPPSPLQEPCTMSIDGDDDAQKGALEEDVGGPAQEVGGEAALQDSALISKEAKDAAAEETELVEDAYDMSVAIDIPTTTDVNKAVVPAAEVEQAEQVCEIGTAGRIWTARLRSPCPCTQHRRCLQL